LSARAELALAASAAAAALDCRNERRVNMLFPPFDFLFFCRSAPWRCYGESTAKVGRSGLE
jgi:hypothetical protein